MSQIGSPLPIPLRVQEPQQAPVITVTPLPVHTEPVPLREPVLVPAR